ncbi:MATE family efflux transporter [Carboxylicivirga mesophila]|uniref:Multidrug-efflux transporter n=1 Tax=Carboxylicivirga mesophila TaxID=1166478 RepID=A0ABS5KET0_9BACT|nr:MATE family efflux transporter [Carboxylicivirga mesophila]MBS2213515.1 MATE family efflux transporter [Carboxylicivirga mesophila]
MKNSYAPHYWPNLKLATPVILAQAGQMLVNLADTLMVGQVGTIPLAAASFANSIFINVLVLGIGISYAITPLVGKAYGAKNKDECAYWFQQGIFANLIIGVLLSVIAGAIVWAMPLMGQEAGVVEEAVPYYLLLVLSILPLQVFNSYKQFAEGLSNTRIAMYITVGGNLLNIGLNYIFIYGHFGAPALGVVGAGIGTLVSRIMMAIFFVWISYRITLFNNYRGIHLTRFSKTAFVSICRLGFPIGLQFVIEVFAFSLGSIMMGWINAVSLAAHQIVLSLASLTYMMSSGLASATTIKVSIFRGQKNYLALKHSAFASIHLVLMFMTGMGILFLTLRYWLPGLFIDDREVIEIAAGLMVVAGLFQIFDGVQVVALGILRGLEDVVMPVIGAGIAYWLISLPVGYLSAFIFSAGPVGIWIGYLAGLASAGIFLLTRFRILYKARYGV